MVRASCLVLVLYGAFAPLPTAGRRIKIENIVEASAVSLGEAALVKPGGDEAWRPDAEDEFDEEDAEQPEEDVAMKAKPKPRPTKAKTSTSRKNKAQGCGGTCKGICFGTWNIQNVGKSKAKKPAVMDAIRSILGRYDVVGIQELSDKPRGNNVCGEYTEDTICAMRPSEDYVVTASPFLKDEQYAIMVKESVGQVVEDATYPDKKEIHSRPPHAFNVNFEGLGRIAIALTHTTPDIATEEIKNFPMVLAWMREKFEKSSKDHFLLAGDYNADGSYFKAKKIWADSVLDSSFDGYAMLTPNGMNSTVAASDNAYDRIIVDDALAKISEKEAAAFDLEDFDLSAVREEGCSMGYIKSSKACSKTHSDKNWAELSEDVRLEVAKEISDHKPVEVCLFTK